MDLNNIEKRLINEALLSLVLQYEVSIAEAAAEYDTEAVEFYKEKREETRNLRVRFLPD